MSAIVIESTNLHLFFGDPSSLTPSLDYHPDLAMPTLQIDAPAHALTLFFNRDDGTDWPTYRRAVAAWAADAITALRVMQADMTALLPENQPANVNGGSHR